MILFATQAIAQAVGEGNASAAAQAIAQASGGDGSSAVAKVS